MNRRRALLNGGLGLALVAVGAGTYLSVSSAGQSTTQAARTVLVSTGNLTSTVTATGNASVVTSIGVELQGSAGVVRHIYVKEGQKVTKGQKLLQIDQTSAKQALKTAKNGVRSAEASYETTTQGQTAQELAQSNASIAASRTSLANAETGLSQAKSSYSLDKKQQKKLVEIAEDAVDRAEKAKDDAQSTADDASSGTSTTGTGTTSGGTTGSGSSTTSTDSAEAAVVSAKNSLTQAKQSRDSTEQKDQQAIQTQEGQVASAQKALNSQVAAANVAAEPARAGAVKAAQVQVDNAEVAVDEAQSTLDDTTLKAPADGTVATISAVIGQSTGSTSSSSGSTSSGSTSSSSTTTSTSSTSSSSTTGLITLTDLDKKQVIAAVAEADVIKVKVGEKVSVAFAATGATLPGTVAAIATQDTVTNNVVTYAVTVTLDGKASSVRIGQSATMTITTGSATDVLVAPTAAITTVGTRSTVTRRENGVDTPVAVETGLVGATQTQITAGLAAGDTLVIPTATATTTTGTTGGRTGLGGLGGGR